uniref:Uncharacterized protein n=1 Tax=Physcomitrium patens TaxID=3218 RepID=A0A7I4BUY2_PHYPA
MMLNCLLRRPRRRNRMRLGVQTLSMGNLLDWEILKLKPKAVWLRCPKDLIAEEGDKFYHPMTCSSNRPHVIVSVFSQSSSVLRAGNIVGLLAQQSGSKTIKNLLSRETSD